MAAPSPVTDPPACSPCFRPSLDPDTVADDVAAPLLWLMDVIVDCDCAYASDENDGDDAESDDLWMK